MRCANPDCSLAATDVTKGVLRLLELDVPPERRVMRSDGGFPICCVPSRYFWLCEDCARFFRIQRWTERGLILERRAGIDGFRVPVHTVAISHRRAISRAM